MEIKRTINGEEITITLTDEEVFRAYTEHLPKHFEEDVRIFLEEHGYPEQDDQTVTEIAERFMDYIEGPIGIMENEKFDEMMEDEYPEIVIEDEEDEDNE